MSAVVSKRDQVLEVIRNSASPLESAALYNRRQILTDGRSFVVVRSQDTWPVNLPEAEDCSRLEAVVSEKLDPRRYISMELMTATVQFNYAEGVVYLHRPPMDGSYRGKMGMRSFTDGHMTADLRAWELVHGLAYRPQIRWCLRRLSSTFSGQRKLSAIGLDERGSVVGWLRGF